MNAIREALLADFEEFDTDTRCGRCGTRLRVSPNPSAGFDVLCQDCGRSKVGVTATDLAWINAEFCSPCEQTGVPAPRARAGETYQ